MTDAPLSASQFPEIFHEDLSNSPHVERSRPVSGSEFQRLASEGAKRYSALRQSKGSTQGIDADFEGLIHRTYQRAQQDWGGDTIDAHTGRSVAPDADKYALTVREPGRQQISVPEGASHAEFRDAMYRMRGEYGDVLARKDHHLGVFHDNDTGRIDIDPVYVTPHHDDVETIGAYTGAVGGAYHFKSGNGFWPPHVADRSRYKLTS